MTRTYHTLNFVTGCFCVCGGGGGEGGFDIDYVHILYLHLCYDQGEVEKTIGVK